MPRVRGCCKDLVAVILLLVVVAWRSVAAQSGGDEMGVCNGARPRDLVSCPTVGKALSHHLGRGQGVADVLKIPTRGLYIMDPVC